MHDPRSRRPRSATPPAVEDVQACGGAAAPYRLAFDAHLKLVVTHGCDVVVQRAGGRHRAPAGRLMAFQPGIAHSGHPEAHGHWSILCVGPDLVGRVADPDGLRLDDPIIGDPDLAAAVAETVDRLSSPSASTAAAPDTAEIVDLVAAIVARATPGRSHQPRHRADRAIAAAALEHLRTTTDRNVSLSEIARVVGADKYRIVRACTEHHGAGPHGLHLRLRIDSARELVASGLPLAQISHDTGFYDQAHFTRTFARATGLTPSQYLARAESAPAESTTVTRRRTERRSPD